MRICTVGYPFAPLGPDAVGGAEQVASALDFALVAAGHDSVVIAPEGSVVAGRLRAVPAITYDIDEARSGQYARVRVAIAETDADLIHLHGIDFSQYVPDTGTVLATIHLPPDWYEPEVWQGRAWLNPVSAAQHRACLPSARLLEPVPNGVPVAALDSRHGRRGYALMLGRICPEKGQHLALRAAHAADVSLLIGGVAYPYPSHLAYLANEVTPLLDHRRRLLGAVNFARKRRLLAGARCLLIPSLAAETSSLVAMEAAACGTPVIAFRAGALPETVRDGVTGFIVDDMDGMAEAIGRARDIDPEACRAEARARFDVRDMTARYMALYERLIG